MLSVPVGGTTSRVRSVRLASAPAYRLSGSATEITTAGTIVMRTDAVSSHDLFLFISLPVFLSVNVQCAKIHGQDLKSLDLFLYF